ncbi:MAG: PilZ domain-containing protein [Thermodesulforhabdaceae bacterium]
MMEEKERRRFTRVGFRTTAEIVKGSISISGEVKDLSLKGAFVVSKEKLPVNQKVEISIYLSGAENPLKVTVMGKVVRTTPEGIGVDFEGMDLDSFNTLKEIVSYNLGSEDTVRKEVFEYLQDRLTPRTS